MKAYSQHSYLIYSEDRYNNKVEVDGKELIVNTNISEKDYMYTNRVATVLRIPSGFDTPVQVGDEVIVHHNTFRRWYDVVGNETEASGFLEDNHFFAAPDTVFAYKHDGVWKALEGYVFIKPVPQESIWNTLGESLLKGILYYTSPELEHLRGHVVGFTPESEYEFNIDGEKIYRVFAHHITIDYGICKTGEKEDNKILHESS